VFLPNAELIIRIFCEALLVINFPRNSFSSCQQPAAAGRAYDEQRKTNPSLPFRGTGGLLSLRRMTEKIIILDFGSQYTQLIARAVREANVYCEIVPFNKSIAYDPSIKGVILSGSPFSVNDAAAPEVNVFEWAQKTPVLGICYGAQLTARQFGGKVERSSKREYGRAILHPQKEDHLLKDLTPASQVWMSHGDSILELPEGFEILATTDSIPVAAFKAIGNGSLATGNTHSMVCNSIRKCIIPLRAKKFCAIFW
jgi:GMP synthase (glutamine-hydrolysing) A subunit